MALITKIDLAGVVGFDAPAALASVHAVRPGMKGFQDSAKTGQGMGGLLALLESGLAVARDVSVAVP